MGRNRGEYTTRTTVKKSINQATQYKKISIRSLQSHPFIFKLRSINIGLVPLHHGTEEHDGDVLYSMINHHFRWLPRVGTLFYRTEGKPFAMYTNQKTLKPSARPRRNTEEGGGD